MEMICFPPENYLRAPVT